jgi:hypothetical protein
MIRESSVTVIEDDDIVSYDRKSSEMSCRDWEHDSMRFHEKLCQDILEKTKTQS